MRKISDDEWDEIFLAEEKQRKRAEQELFEQALTNGVGAELTKERLADESGKRKNLEIKLQKSFSPEVDARLDLHMKTREESDKVLPSFFRNAVVVGDRTLLVITGKGHHSSKKGVLRKYVQNWFNSDGWKWILWFAEAPRSLGGSGAWLVQLKR